MAYRHITHAGNFADVFKHAVLSVLLRTLRERTGRPLLYVETHAGAGAYDLGHAEAQGFVSFRQGIGRLWKDGAIADVALAGYLGAVRALNGKEGHLRHYPGSPYIARFLLSEQDQMILYERDAEECECLRRIFGTRARVHCADGYAGLMQMVLGPMMHGLAFVDPPFDQPDELQRVSEAVRLISSRWGAGCCVVWYPVFDTGTRESVRQALRASGARPILVAEISVPAKGQARRMQGCGMALVNAPRAVVPPLRRLLPLLAERLRQTPQGTSGLTEIRA